MKASIATAASASRLRLVRLAGYGLAGTFAVVGLIFLFTPGQVLAAFNRLSSIVGLSEIPGNGYAFYLALAVAYMYVVTLLAWMMTRRPAERVYPWLLVNAKAASALLSLALFVASWHSLILLANFAVDGAIAVAVAWLCLRR